MSNQNSSSDKKNDLFNISGLSLNIPSIPAYHYPYFIETPSEANLKVIGSDFGNLHTIGGNMAAIIEYIELLTIGNSGVSKADDIGCSMYTSNGYCITGTKQGGAPLGNAYFYDTSFQCTDSNGIKQPVSMYVNNIPTGKIPFMPGGSILKGLIPGLLENVFNMHPGDIISAFDVTSDTSCVEVLLPTSNINANGMRINDNGPILNGPKKDNQIPRRYMYPQFSKEIFPCWFYKCDSNKSDPTTGIPKNWDSSLSYISSSGAQSCSGDFIPLGFNPTPGSGEPCIDGFNNINSNIQYNLPSNLYSNLQYSYIDFKQEDTLVHLYFIAITILFLFILLKLLYKHIK